MFSSSTSMQTDWSNRPLDQLWAAITEHSVIDEEFYLEQLLTLAEGSELETQQIKECARDLIQRVRNTDSAVRGVDALLQEYSLDTQEGLILMCLAEALMRIPDPNTADALIREKLSSAEWNTHLGNSESVFVNAATWGLLLTGKVIRVDTESQGSISNILKRLIHRSGEPVIRKAIYEAIKILSKQFVLGSNIKEALKNACRLAEQGYTYSFDMLGEAAITQQDAAHYFASYARAIEAVAQENRQVKTGVEAFTVSIKLSALHPRYEQSQHKRILTELYQKVLQLLKLAREHNVGITLDAEEADRLELSLVLFEKLYRADVNQGWGRLGLVVQAYSKCALSILAWLTKLSEQVGIEVPVRLVKGAYWDSEIKRCQQMGIESYPVFTRKESTDVSYLACARFLLSEPVRGKIYPQFASHNAHTVASVLTLAKNQDRRFEFQRLHGMGNALYAAVINVQQVPVRIYAPVGVHKDLMPYLVRRLLENGANSSFVHRLVDAKTPIESLITHPAQALRRYNTLTNPNIGLPALIFSDRMNSQGLNLNVAIHREPLLAALRDWDTHFWQAGCLIQGITVRGADAISVVCPHRRSEHVGRVYWGSAEEVDRALIVAEQGFCDWHRRSVRERADILDSIADLYEQHRVELMALCCREAGKTLQDSMDEIREAVDFCRYYVQQALKAWDRPLELPGPTGEYNSLQCIGRGVFLCISPWNFPLAIFTGQVVAALVSGNAVIAKPAEQTSLIAYRAVSLMLAAGIPKDVLQLVLGKGTVLGSRLVADKRIAGVAFTGSIQTAHLINRALAGREGAIVPLVAETGGQNAMLVDSTALPEQVVKDVIQSAFTSAGQRCSALRVLFVQADIADRVVDLLKGAMQELQVADPADYATDVGPVIDEDAQDRLLLHIERMQREACLVAQAPMNDVTQKGFFVRPTLFEIQSMQQLKQEHFGPILHLIRYPSDQLERVIKDINDSGYGLTLGVHSRNEAMAQYIADRVSVGNVYINRNQIGAVVGVQPFGGQGLSGTGPKAGGPHYLLRFVTEKTITVNTTAVGGNATLLSSGGGSST